MPSSTGAEDLITRVTTHGLLCYPVPEDSASWLLRAANQRGPESPPYCSYGSPKLSEACDNLGLDWTGSAADIRAWARPAGPAKLAFHHFPSLIDAVWTRTPGRQSRDVRPSYPRNPHVAQFYLLLALGKSPHL